MTDTDPVQAANIANGIADVFPTIVADIVSGSSAKIIDRAMVPTARYSLSYKRNIMLGAFAGLLAMSAFVLIRAFTDDSITSPADLENLGYPLLAIIPDLKESTAGSGGYGYAYASSRGAAKKSSQRTVSKDGESRAAL